MHAATTVDERHEAWDFPGRDMMSHGFVKPIQRRP